MAVAAWFVFGYISASASSCLALRLGSSLPVRPQIDGSTRRAAPRLDITVRTLARPEDLGDATALEALVSSAQPERGRLVQAKADLPVSVGLLALQIVPVAALADESLRVPILSYGFFGVSAVATVWLGARVARLQPDVESLQLRNAVLAPFIASAWLFGLYYLMKYTSVDPGIIFTFVTSLFGCLSAIQVIQPFAALALGASAQPQAPAQRSTAGTKALWRGPASLALATAASVGLLGAYYGVLPAGAGLALLAGNLLALCSVQALLCTVVPETFVAAAALLGGLFFYDIFWVFKSDAMMTVATGLDAPIKVQFPAPSSRPYPFSLLGLGDLAVPGLFASVCARIDASLSENAVVGGAAPAAGDADAPAVASRAAPGGYLARAIAAYGVALCACFYANLVSGHGQPALLYIVPALLATTLGVAAARGELAQVGGFEADGPERLSGELGEAERRTVKAAKAWVGQAVLPLNLCPYARAPFELDQYLYAISNATDPDGFIGDFLEAADDLLLRPKEQVAATVLLAPRLAGSMSEAEFGALGAMLEDQCADEEEPICDGKVGAAFFHPDHLFEGIGPDEPTHFERRAPFPCATILRADEVGIIVKEGLRSGRIISKEIQDANARRLRQEGSGRLRELYARFHEAGL